MTPEPLNCVFHSVGSPAFVTAGVSFRGTYTSSRFRNYTLDSPFNSSTSKFFPPTLAVRTDTPPLRKRLPRTCVSLWTSLRPSSVHLLHHSTFGVRKGIPTHLPYGGFILKISLQKVKEKTLFFFINLSVAPYHRLLSTLTKDFLSLGP